MKEIPIKELGWRSNIHLGTTGEIDILYLLNFGPTEHLELAPTLDEKIAKVIEHINIWSLGQFEPPQSYELLGHAVTPTFEIAYINRAMVGDIFGSPEGSFRADLVVHHPSKDESGPRKFWHEAELPSEMRELLGLVDEFAWQKMREDIIRRFRLPEKSVPAHSPKHVFIAYRSGNRLSIEIARKLGKYLRKRGIPIWLFPWRVGWADSITNAEEEAITRAFASVIVYTSDFLKGPTAIEEYRALMAKKRDDPKFKVGMMLVGVEYDEAPALMRDYFHAKVLNLVDPCFEQQATIIYRGILGLPIESPSL